jgi:uncharacterized protein (TIGR03086 family)
VEIFDALDRAVASTSGVVKTVRPDHFRAATPCTEWDVHALLNHLVGTLWLGEALFTDSVPRHPVAPGGLPATDLVGDDPVAAYLAGAAALLAAARAGDTLTRIHTTPFGDMPGPALAGFTTLDILVHGWDLAAATGQPASLDEDLAGHVLAFASQAITDESRGVRIGPAIPVDATAPVTDRLMGFLGRQP